MFDNNYFTESGLYCRYCGKIPFSDDTLRRLIRVEERFNKLMIINSGYRCATHCVSIGSTMTQTTGQAIDVLVIQGYACRCHSAADRSALGNCPEAHSRRFLLLIIIT
ncbi:D-Ala-D-Ala carboxypeptidase family metallohydrolase [Microbulbifer sp. 2304DJ12-6]|uniref:D-Ala-D-Ala carboxypeptidase family metallohydrolase n=1 Tax=Microbulbifer sp. 2304DJ12-6 TaxID=3233340 RepID=UPI0039B02D1E